jgi:stage III sporulation protein AG
VKVIIGEKKYTFTARVKELIKRPKFLQIAVIVGLAAMGLIFISGLSKPKEEKVQAEVGVFYSSDEYAKKIENELTEIISKIEGVGDADILVTIGVSEEYVYAEDGKHSGGNASSEIVVIGAGDDKHALTQKIISPKITGVVIVCEGGDDSRTVEKVYKAVSAATGIGASRIYVAERK